MAVEEVKQVVGRALLDAGFRTTLLSDPASALAEYDLTEEEFEAFRHLTAERLHAVQTSVFEGLRGGKNQR